MKAQAGLGQIGASGADITAGIVGVAAGAITTFLVYHYSTHNHKLKGCAVSSPAGLQLINEGDKQTYELTGDVGLIKPGERVRLSGKKLKTDRSHEQFVVTKVSKDYGACKEMPTPAL